MHARDDFKTTSDGKTLPLEIECLQENPNSAPSFFLVFYLRPVNPWTVLRLMCELRLSVLNLRECAHTVREMEGGEERTREEKRSVAFSSRLLRRQQRGWWGSKRRLWDWEGCGRVGFGDVSGS